MAIHQTKKQSDLEKRLKILRQQFYGKSSEQKPIQSEQLPHRYTNISTLPQASPSTAVLKNDISYLKGDLLKILTFSSIAIGAQIVLKIIFF